MSKVNLSKQEIANLMQKGRVLKQDANGGYTVEYNGKRYYIPKNMAIFNATNPLETQTRKFIAKRDKEIAQNEALLSMDTDNLNKIKGEFKHYLSSNGITLGKEENLSGEQKAKIYDFQTGISKLKKSINRVKMSIMGDLLSNFMDYCSIMKMH